MNEWKQAFEEKYGVNGKEARTFFAPGRVNLIGEHIDYNGGFVFPAALSFGTAVVARPRDDRKIHLASQNFNHEIEVDLDDLSFLEEHLWANYPKGMLVHMQNNGLKVDRGFDILISGSIPGSGLSSSASILVAFGYAMNALNGGTFSKIDIAKIAQQAENKYMGVNCGIMDQFSIAMGEKNRALKLNCDTLDYESVPIEAEGYKWVITNTNKRRGLVDSAYNERRSQCEAAVQALRQAFPNLNYLCSLNAAQLEQNKALITDEVVYRRAKHAVEENDRVLDSVAALKANDFVKFGQLMTASHLSLQHQFEVSCYELDVLAEAAWNIDGVLGSRMTGAGFGGCTVTFIKESSIPTFIAEVGKIYTEKTGLVADFYIAEIGDGVREVK